MATHDAEQLVYSPPTNFAVNVITHSSVDISWEHHSDQHGQHGSQIKFSHFHVECSRVDTEEFVHRTVHETCMTLEPLSPNTIYLIQVRAVYSDLRGNQFFSDACEPIECRTRVYVHVAEAIRRQSQKSIERCGIDVYNLMLKRKGEEHYFFGEPDVQKKRTVLVIGATGSGKTTLINAMANYILGVRWEFDFRFKLIRQSTNRSQAHSQTEGVTIYDLYPVKGGRLDYPLRVVDTPGFGDTTGHEKDKEIFEEIKKYLVNEDSDSAPVSLEAVCLVLSSTESRSTATQKYIFSSILSLFGKDMKDSICLMMTFADDTTSCVLDTIRRTIQMATDPSTGLPLHYKFNNSAFFVRKDPTTDDFNKRMFNMAISQFESFFGKLSGMESKSLVCTRKALSSRKELQALVERILSINQMMQALTDDLDVVKTSLATSKNLMEANKDFEIEMEVPVYQQTDISGTGQFATNCQTCINSCHFPCSQAEDDENKRMCSVMDKETAKCKKCGCSSDVHLKEKHRYTMMKRQIKKTSDVIRNRYEDAKKEASAKQEELDTIQKELDEQSDELCALMEDAGSHIKILEEIALQPQPVSEAEYLDLLINNEESERSPDQQKIANLRNFRQLTQVREELEILCLKCRSTSVLDAI